jgi:hypothetical protein
MKNPLRRKKEFFKKILKELKSLISLKIEYKYAAGWSSLVARQAHNLKVGGSNPSPATNYIKYL